MNPAPDTGLVRAAQAGDPRARQELFAAHLSLVYNVVGRALDGHPDTDDVVQETMLRAVAALPRLRDPDRFRSWLIAIAVRQTQERGRARGTAQARLRQLADWTELPDPAADPEGETLASVSLSTQRREVAAATRWLTPTEQSLLALWWQEVAGVLTRTDLAAALGITVAHAAVRVQRMKAQLDLARQVVQAWRADPRCPGLDTAARDPRRRQGPLSLRRAEQHVQDCAVCAGRLAPLVPAERLLTGATLLPVPVALAAKVAGLLSTGAVATNAGSVGLAVGDWLRRGVAGLSAKTAVIGGSSLAAATAAAVLAVHYLPASPPAAKADPPQPTPSASAPATAPSPSASPSPSRAPAAAARPVTGVAAAELYVAPGGSDTNPGTLTAPLASLNRAVELVRPGQTIALRGGTYRATGPVTITTSGTESQRITLSNYRDEQPVLDATTIRDNQWYVTQRASYWTVQGLTVQHAKTFPYVCVSCRGSVFQRLSMHDNGATGLVLRGPGTVGNRVLDSDFHDNHDDAAHGANADGVAFKDGDGAGNVIRGCRAFRNADDGVDLSGFADPVTVERNWAYGNGVNRWGLADFAGAGTGFKLGGGDPVPAARHVVRDNAAWDNASYGFTEQNNPGAITVTGNTAFRNGGDGFAFWYSPSVLEANLALGNGRDDNRGDTAHESGNSWNQSGWTVALLRSADPAAAEGPRRPDGTLPGTTFLTPTRPGVGAKMAP
ncbi:sigma-70 family RNA polymerase sigma factor [Catellatospora tritici]|uniref:sigma-70 family RNA polymerase sigma factor n=1 Tax=Catellatospora tritici TaxID=2851566 RepID=UPI001C2DAA23|nr:sigma-70 family RNA polymerase sigma factor [Catellatospora tritici]MBV1850745.1 sigma-70 family RNA polymerase sigma factor [Catellatospora tritici]MBV1850998.1 sigma-70 family RNA polymerase sigma factor [Catellatospora tritici]